MGHSLEEKCEDDQGEGNVHHEQGSDVGEGRVEAVGDVLFSDGLVLEYQGSLYLFSCPHQRPSQYLQASSCVRKCPRQGWLFSITLPFWHPAGCLRLNIYGE
jgi:hypothetical protein